MRLQSLAECKRSSGESLGSSLFEVQTMMLGDRGERESMLHFNAMRRQELKRRPFQYVSNDRG
jgi:hypothetical protein